MFAACMEGKSWVLCVGVSRLTEDEVPDEVLAPEVVEPVVRVGGPGEYMAAADPGRGTGIGKSSGLM